jgi:hypothetical protein
MTYIIIIVLIIIFTIILDVYLLKRNRKPDGKIIIIMNDDGKKIFSLELDIDPDNIGVGDYILFKVMDEPSEDLE